MIKFNRGVTLLEVVIAAFVLAIAFLPILRVVNFGSVSTVKIGNYAKASKLAQELIEECKHVPFKVYQKEYEKLGSGESFPVNPQFYKNTSKSMEEFFDEKKGFVKDFDCKAELKAKKNAMNQIVEIWFNVEILWREKGKADDKRFAERRVRAGNAYFNADSI